MELIYRYAWVLGALGAALAVATGSLAWLYGGLDSTCLLYTSPSPRD